MTTSPTIEVGDSVTHYRHPGWWFTVTEVHPEINRATIRFGSNGIELGSVPLNDLERIEAL